jgi:hypothetical protein
MDAARRATTFFPNCFRAARDLSGLGMVILRWRLRRTEMLQEIRTIPSRTMAPTGLRVALPIHAVLNFMQERRVGGRFPVNPALKRLSYLGVTAAKRVR